jgi:NADPH-dependent 2,4-dienoyl-CoA reductase/sulfur reductase-like enzyme/rhodanese-related sulfurtransferase
MKYLIVGAVAGGASAAARLRRLDEQAEIVIFEKGEYISYANCGLPYYIGNVIKEREKLFVQTATAFNKRFNIDVRISTEITFIDTKNKTVTARHRSTGTEYIENYDKLILSPGAEPVKPPLPGINSEGIFTLRNVTDTDYIKSCITTAGVKKAVIVGGGFIGLEMAENLHHLGIEVTIVEMGNQVMAPVDFPIAAIVQQHMRSKGVDLKLKTSVTGFARTTEGLSVQFSNNTVIDTDLVILSIGVRPDTKLATSAGLAIGEARGIVVNQFLQTSDADIYAVGDAIEFKNPITGKSGTTFLAGPANKQGRICAENVAYGNIRKYNGSINTSIVKVFDLTVAATGLSSKQLSKEELEHIVATTHAGSHAGYYPDSKQMTIQITFSPLDGKLFGAQIVGYDGVDKRIDVLATIIKVGGTVYDLTAFEHAYAPPYSSAKDPVNMAGFVAENILMQRLKIFYWDKLGEITSSDMLLDVRAPSEYEGGKIPGAINIPLDELRERLAEIPKDKKIYIYCEAGLRGYLAQRILLQRGYSSVSNLSGGYRLWKNCIAEL